MIRHAPKISLLLLLLVAACEVDQRRGGVPTGAQAVIDKVTNDIAAGRYEEIYTEAAEEWRQAATPEESRAALQQVRDRLGRVGSRSFHTGREQESAGSDAPARSLIVSYQTTFERGHGTETFTLIERNGRWMMARYFVSSDALKQ
ncbi:MAG TPA: DUF4019 domain-containing protein [Pyrinomonadaceae bacterium]|nr:DUF4019 domain-containing protein [Pyrinomonadaceae bacterium]